MPDESLQDRSTESLMDDGYAALAAGDDDGALHVAAELRRRRHSSTFEIEARARWAKGEREAAVEVLEEGVAKAPKALPLWHWLACYRSDLGRYEGALEAFAREAEFEDVVPSANAYNVAVVLERMGRSAEALDVVDRVEMPGSSGPSAAHFSELRARLLFDVGRFNEAVEAATVAEKQFASDVDARATNDAEMANEDAPSEEPSLDWDMMARAFAVRADARLATGDAAGAIEDAAASIGIEPSGAPGRALAALRQADGRRSRAARRLELLVRGEIPTKGATRRLGFYKWVKVVADDAADAMEFVRRFVPQDAHTGLVVDESKDCGPGADQLKGVYECGAAAWFDPDASDEDDSNDDQP